MDSFNQKLFFTELNPRFAQFITTEQSVLTILAKLESWIKSFFLSIPPEKPPEISGLAKSAAGYYFSSAVEFAAPYVDHDLLIYFGSGVRVEPSALVQPRTVILDNSQIRHGCYVRGNCAVGANCVLGHCSEIKHSLLLDNSAAGHFNYVGDSIIGNRVNLGAGAKLANLEFRSLTAKLRREFKPLWLSDGKVRTKSEFVKLGAIIGAGSEIGCNAVLSPGCFLGIDCRVMPGVCVAKGYYQGRSFMR